MTKHLRNLSRAVTALLAALLSVVTLSAEAPRKVFDVPAGEAAAALKQFTAQSGAQLLYSTQELAGVKTQSVKGNHTVQEALDAMLADTGLVASQDAKTGAIAVRRSNGDPGPNAPRAARTVRSDRPTNRATRADDGAIKMDIFEVMGSKLLNMDLPRGRDDMQPYVIFEREMIERSGATDLDDFLKSRLTMNSVDGTPQQRAVTNSLSGTSSSINLRGLSQDQTLLLVDGRRLPTQFLSGATLQPNINGIPLSAIERIEILPSSASGIYGGSATGGVINIVLRRDYSGAELKLTYDNSFDTDSARRRVDFNVSLTLEDGKTSLLLGASHSDSNPLLVQDRSFGQRGLALQFANNPTSIFNATIPPVAATPNIRSSTGANLVLKTGVALNSPRTFIPAGYAGVTTDQGAALVANAGRYNLSSSGDANGSARSLLNHPRHTSYKMSVRRQFNIRLQLFLDVFSQESIGRSITAVQSPTSVLLQPTALNNPFTTPIRVSFPTPALIDTLRTVHKSANGTIGALVELGREWKAEADFSISRATSAYQVWRPQLSAAGTTALNTGTLDVMKDVNLFPVNFLPFVVPPPNQHGGPWETTATDATVRAAGPVAFFSSRSLTVSAMVNQREERFSDSFNTIVLPDSTSVTLYPHRSQRMRSAYIESKLPLVTERTAARWARSLDLQLALRYGEIKVNGTNMSVSSGAPVSRVTNTTDSRDLTFGLRYAPSSDLALRASFGTGFVPPGVNQLVPSVFTGSNIAGLIDPRRGGLPLPPGSSTELTFGGDPNLRPESSESRSGGLVLTPRLLPKFRLSIDYTHIQKADEMTQLTQQQLLDNETLLPGRVIRGPNLPGDPTGWAGPITALKWTLVNLSRAEMEAFDLQIDYARDTHIGAFSVFGSATWQRHLRRQVAPSAPVVEFVGYSGSPLEFKANAGLTWRSGGWSAGWTMRYFDSHLVYSATASANTVATAILNQGSAIVPSQNYHDVFVSREVSRSRDQAGFLGRYFGGTELTLGIRNIFNTEPPILANASELGGYSFYGDPRLASYYITLRKAF
jgi:iron complex outermembrane recepter protein